MSELPETWSLCWCDQGRGERREGGREGGRVSHQRLVLKKK